MALDFRLSEKFGFNEFVTAELAGPRENQSDNLDELRKSGSGAIPVRLKGDRPRSQITLRTFSVNRSNDPIMNMKKLETFAPAIGAGSADHFV
jgi:hypothetical protein